MSIAAHGDEDLGELLAAAQALEQAQAAFDAAVRRARERGTPWARLARVLATSAAALRRKYGPPPEQVADPAVAPTATPAPRRRPSSGGRRPCAGAPAHRRLLRAAAELVGVLLVGVLLTRVAAVFSRLRSGP